MRPNLRLQNFLATWQAIGPDILGRLQIGGIVVVLILPAICTPATTNHRLAISKHIVGNAEIGETGRPGGSADR